MNKIILFDHIKKLSQLQSENLNNIFTYLPGIESMAEMSPMRANTETLGRCFLLGYFLTVGYTVIIIMGMGYNMCNITGHQNHPKHAESLSQAICYPLDISKSLPIFEWYNTTFPYRYILHRCAGYVFSK